jgi:hypothetical protein
MLLVRTKTAGKKGAFAMMIIGCDFHPSWQQVSWLDTATGECGQRKLVHASGEAGTITTASDWREILLSRVLVLNLWRQKNGGKNTEGIRLRLTPPSFLSRGNRTYGEFGKDGPAPNVSKTGNASFAATYDSTLPTTNREQTVGGRVPTYAPDYRKSNSPPCLCKQRRDKD